MSPKRIAPGIADRTADVLDDFSLGLCTGRSDVGIGGCRHLRRANNVSFDIQRALSVRPGFRDITDYVLAYEPHSLAKFYATGANKAFAGAGPHLYAVDETTGYAEQAMPFAISDRWWHEVNINAALVAAQEGGTNPPAAYNGIDWNSIVFPTSGAIGLTGVETASRLASAADLSYAGAMFGGYGFDVKSGYLDQLYVIVSSVTYTATLTAGTGFTSATRAADATAKLNALGHGLVFTVSYAANKFTVAATGGNFELITNGSYPRNAAAMLGFAMGFAHTGTNTYTAESSTLPKRFWFSASGVNVLWKFSDAVNTTCCTVLGFAAVDDGSGASSFALGDSDVNELITFTTANNKLRFAESGTDRDVTMDPTGAGPAYSAGGSVDTGTHAYRQRWLFANGASIAGPAINAVVPGAGSNTVAFTSLPISARSDYIGFQIERQKLGDTTTWWYDGGVLGNGTTYTSTRSDASLDLAIPTEPGPYGHAPHFDNIAVYRGRLIGMVGSTLYPSRPVGDVEAPGAGVFNFMASQSFPVTEFDDGDAIVAWAPQGDRLVILKGKSGHALAGFDPSTFYVTPLFHGMGAASTRGACSHGTEVFFYDGGARLFRLDGNTVTPWGVARRRALEPDVSDYLATITRSAESKVVMANYLGSLVLVAYPASPVTYNNEVLAYRTSDGVWEHYTNVRIADVIVQSRRDDFSQASMIFADPLIQPAASAQGFATNPSFAIWLDNRAAPAQFYAQKLNSAGTSLLTANGVAVSAVSAGAPASKAVVSDATGSGFLSAYAADQGGNGGFAAVYVQKTDSLGVNQFGSGILLSAAFPYSFAQVVAAAVQDGAGGIVVAWYDPSSGTLRVGRVDSAGVLQWSTSIDTSVLAGPTGVITLLPDGAAGYYVVWNNSTAIKVQRLNAAGAIQYAAGGVTVSTSSFAPYGVARTSTGGLIVARWTGTGATLTAYVLNSSGALTATSANLAPATTLNRGKPLVVADLEGGAITGFAVQPVSGTDKLYAQRISSSAAPLWVLQTIASYGVGITGGTAIGGIPDGAGGAIFTWQDLSPVVNYVQRVTANGVLSWGAGVALSAAGASATVIATDGSGGVIATWALSTDIYSQRVGSDGLIRWASGGVVVCSATGTQSAPVLVFTNAPQGEAPTGSAPGYHLWAGFEGDTDARPRSGTSAGEPIAWYAEPPEMDGGEPDVVKEYEAIEVHAARGLATVGAAITLDAGALSANVPVAVSAAGAKWGGNGVVNADTLYWGPATGANPSQPHTWGGDVASVSRAGLAGGFLGRRYRIAFSADVTGELVVNAIVIDYKRRPDRTFERTY